MSRSKLGIFGLCTAALGLMAFMATSASAAPQWLILNPKTFEVKTGTELPAEINTQTESDVTLLTKLIGIKVAVLCSFLSVSFAKLEGGGSITNGFSSALSGCSVGTFGCTVHSAGRGTGLVESFQLKGQLQTNGETLIQPKTGTVLTELIFEGSICPLPTGVNEPINGVLWIKDGNGEAANLLVEHLIVESTAHGATLWIGKDTAEHLETSADGSARAWLGGTHFKMSWGASFP